MYESVLLVCWLQRAAALLRKSVGIEREFVSAEMQTFVTFLETIQSNASLLFRCHMADLVCRLLHSPCYALIADMCECD